MAGNRWSDNKNGTTYELMEELKPYLSFLRVIAKLKVCHLPGVIPRPQTPSLVPSPHRSNKVDPNLNPLSSFSAVDGRGWTEGRPPREGGRDADDGQTRSPNLEAETSAAAAGVRSSAVRNSAAVRAGAWTAWRTE